MLGIFHELKERQQMAMPKSGFQLYVECKSLSWNIVASKMNLFRYQHCQKLRINQQENK